MLKNENILQLWHSNAYSEMNKMEYMDDTSSDEYIDPFLSPHYGVLKQHEFIKYITFFFVHERKRFRIAKVLYMIW